MRPNMQSNWWNWLLRGLLLLLLGLFALALPGLTLAVFALGVAVYFVLVGVLNIMASLGAVGRAGLWFLTFVLGAVEVGVGAYAFKNLGMAVATLILLVGLVLVVRGIVELIAAFGEAYDARHRSLNAILGGLALVAGVAVWLYPASGGLAFSWLVGLYGLVAGAFTVSLALEAKTSV